MGSEEPFRIDLFDRDIDSIRTFDPETQRTREHVDRIEFLPAREFPLDDQATFALLCRGETKGVFQLESGGIRDLLQKMKPDHFSDIIATNALYRPGPLEGGMVDDYIAVKHGLPYVYGAAVGTTGAADTYGSFDETYGDDITAIALEFLRTFAKEEGKDFASFAPLVEVVFRRYHWLAGITGTAREALFHRFGEAIGDLLRNGKYVGGLDMGTGPGDILALNAGAGVHASPGHQDSDIDSNY